MPDITHDSSRHTILDAREGHYLAFPDIICTPDGRLFAVYRESDKHVARRKKLLLRESSDAGRTWSQPRIINANGGHCPRFSLLSSDQTTIIDDHPPLLYWSGDSGVHWTHHPANGLQHGIPDRIIELGPNQLLTTAHLSRGTHPHPVMSQPPTEQMVYLSEDRGLDWRPLSVMNRGFHLTLCEASMLRLAEDHIIALLRENSGVLEPMYLCESMDAGRTWTDPRPTPLIGHRPTLGRCRNGKLLVTYRATGLDTGTAAWMGDLEDLDDFKPTGVHPCAENPKFTPEGMLIHTTQGPEDCALFGLRPLSDPEQARAVLEAEVQAFEGEKNACGLRLGVWWRIGPDFIRPDIPGARKIKLPPEQINTVRITYDRGSLTLHINNRKRTSYALDAADIRRRAILFGNTSDTKKNRGKSLWRRISLTITEPRYLRNYSWEWTPDAAAPDAFEKETVLMLQRDRDSNPGDYGYSGWAEVEKDVFLAIYHSGNGQAEEYAPGYESRIMLTRLYSSDFF